MPRCTEDLAVCSVIDSGHYTELAASFGNPAQPSHSLSGCIRNPCSSLSPSSTFSRKKMCANELWKFRWKTGKNVCAMLVFHLARHFTGVDSRPVRGRVGNITQRRDCAPRDYLSQLFVATCSTDLYAQWPGSFWCMCSYRCIYQLHSGLKGRNWPAPSSGRKKKLLTSYLSTCKTNQRCHRKV